MSNDKDGHDKPASNGQVSSFVPNVASSKVENSAYRIRQGMPRIIGQAAGNISTKVHSGVGPFGSLPGPFTNLAGVASAAEPTWMKVAKENQDILGSIAKNSIYSHVMNEAFPAFKFAQSIAEPAWMKAMRDHQSNFQAMVDRIQRSTSIFSPVLEQARRFQNEFTSYLKRIEGPLASMGQQFAEFAHHLDRYPGEVREGLLVMGRYGWYLDFEMGMSEPIKFKTAVESGRELDAKNEMIGHFESRADSIRQALVDLYPKRAHVLKAAFEAYANGQYLLAIPTFLAQVDGICLDVVNAHFFMAKGRKKVVEHVMSVAGGSIARAFLVSFEDGMEVSLSEWERPEGFSGLNRHMILHGESVDYGTKENCLKSISLLNYISQAIQRALDKIDEDSRDRRDGEGRERVSKTGVNSLPVPNE